MPRKTISYFKDITKVLELAEKPDSKEFKHVFRLVFLGFLITGAISFGIAMLITVLLDMTGAGLGR